MSPTPTGRREARDGHDLLAFDRTFRAPIESVWAAVTESDRLARWIGVWTGDPASGGVQFRMTAEGEEVEAETFTIEACEPPRLLALTSQPQGQPEGQPQGQPEGQPQGQHSTWRFRLELSEHAGTTTLTFSQTMVDAETAASMGPGWDYYLDRLVAAETGGEVAAIDFDDYYPAQADHYRALFA